jgi:hypothetical protein
MRPCDFWALTVAEFNEIAALYADTKKEHVKELLYQAWHIAAFTRQEKMPELSEVLKSLDKTEDKPVDMVDKCRALNAMFGGKETR